VKRPILAVAAVLIFAACAGTDASSTTTASPSETTTSTGPQPITATDAGLSWWNDSVFYEVFVRSFSDSDADGIGDFIGLTQQLDYLNDGDPTTTRDLGVTGIWLMPIFDSPSYHGYDVTDYFTLNPEYGTMDDFERFLDEAHQRGISVIIDLVLNHSSSEHPWFIGATKDDSPTVDWYIFEEEDPGWRGPWGQNVWHDRGEDVYYGIFWEGMPDLNLTNRDTTAEMHRIARYWLDDVGVDGFRIDAARHLIEDGDIQEDTPETLAWLADFSTSMHELDQTALVLGEVWTDSEIVSTYIPESLDLAFEFTLSQAFLTSMSRWDATSIRDAQQSVLAVYPDAQYAPFLTNHDQDRVMTQLGGNVERAKTAATWLLTSPGVPFLYYGEEVGLEGAKPDERIRTPMPWTDAPIRVGFTEGIPWEPPDLGFSIANVQLETDDSYSLLSLYRRLIQFRSTSNALRFGATTVIEPGTTDLYVVARSYGGQHVVVVMNMTGREVADYSIDLSQIVTGGATATPLVGVLDEAAVIDPTTYRPVASIPPYAAIVIEVATDE
jgi:glycosidase